MNDIRTLRSIDKIGKIFALKRQGALLFSYEEELFAIALGKYLHQHAESLFSTIDQETIRILATSPLCERNADMLEEMAELGGQEYTEIIENCARARAEAHKAADRLINQRLNELDDSDPVKWEYLARQHVEAQTYEPTPVGWVKRMASNFEDPAMTFTDSLLRRARAITKTH